MNNNQIASILLSFLLLACSAFPLSAQNQSDEEGPNIDEMVEKAVENLDIHLKLEDWQIFYVDSTLAHDYNCLKMELDELKEAKVSNSSLFEAVQDKWMQRIDDSYKKIFTEEQWTMYLKSGAKKKIEAREKRKAKIEKATQAIKEKKK